MTKSENLNDLTVKELSSLADKTHKEIMDLYDKEDKENNEEIGEIIEEKIRLFNQIKSLILDLHSDEPYPRGG